MLLKFLLLSIHGIIDIAYFFYLTAPFKARLFSSCKLVIFFLHEDPA